jgi:hypothetical protein
MTRSLNELGTASEAHRRGHVVAKPPIVTVLDNDPPGVSTSLIYPNPAFRATRKSSGGMARGG